MQRHLLNPEVHNKDVLFTGKAELNPIVAQRENSRERLTVALGMSGNRIHSLQRSVKTLLTIAGNERVAGMS